MADKVADLSGEEREKRIAELKAKMQSAAKKTKDTSTEGGAGAPKAEKRAAAAEEVVVAEQVATPPAKTVMESKAMPKASTNGASTNGAAAAADLAQVVTAPAFVEDSPEVKARKEMNRREFLTYAWGGVLGLIALQSGVGMFQFMMPRFKAGEFGGVFFMGSDTALPPTDAVPEPVVSGKFWWVNTEDQGPLAIYMVCTHLGCLYKWEQSNNRFECPCHGSKFTREGLFIEGPAPRSLDTFVITIENGEVAVNTGRRVLGAPASESPARVIPV